jgi:glycosyltransferase involved in cell wall biosynthesis
MPLSISTVIPLYNHERYIGAALSSVFCQTRRAQEIIVVDDGSHDAGMEIVRTMQRSRRELIAWSHPNRGAHNTINAGLARSTGDLVAILNSDDAYEPKRFERVAKQFEEDSTLDAVATNMDFIDSDGNATTFPWFDQALHFYRDCGDMGLALVNGNFFVTTSNLVVRRRVFAEIGAFSDLRYAHDLDFFLRLLIEKKVVRFLDEPLLKYRIHTHNTISEGALKVKSEWAAVTAFYLARMARTAGPEAITPYLTVLARHALSEAVIILVPYFLLNPSETFERNKYHMDAQFKDRVQEVLS